MVEIQRSVAINKRIHQEKIKNFSLNWFETADISTHLFCYFFSFPPFNGNMDVIGFALHEGKHVGRPLTATFTSNRSLKRECYVKTVVRECYVKPRTVVVRWTPMRIGDASMSSSLRQRTGLARKSDGHLRSDICMRLLLRHSRYTCAC